MSTINPQRSSLEPSVKDSMQLEQSQLQFSQLQMSSSPNYSPNKREQSLGETIRLTQEKPISEVFMDARRILKKSPEIRTPADVQVLIQLSENNQFLKDLVENVSLECYKGLMKQAKIEEVRERQLLCEEGKPVTHIVVVLDGKLGVCKQQDDFEVQMNHKSAAEEHSPSKKDKQTRTIAATVTPMQNLFDQLTAISCKQIQQIRKKNLQLKRKSSIPITAGLFLPLPYSKEQFEQYEIEGYVSAGEEYGAKVRARSKIHTNTCFAVERSTLLILEWNMIVYWFEHAFRAKLGETIEKLKKIPAFSFLQDGKLAQCILFMKKQKKRRNDYIYRQGSPSDKLYILLQGQVKLSKQAKLFQQNPNQLYIDRRKLIHRSSQLHKQDQSKKIDILPYANFTTLYNFRPIRKNIEIGIITSHNDCYCLIGEEELLERRGRETDAQVTSFECEFYEIGVKRLEEVLGSKFVEEFYAALEKSLQKVILYRQNQYAEKVNLQNRQNLDYFYLQNDKAKQSPRKYKLQKINNKFNQPTPGAQRTPQPTKHTFQPQHQSIKPYYTTFNFHKLIKTQRLSHTRRQSQRKPQRVRKDSQDSTHEPKIKFSPLEQRLIDISHTWKPIKKKVIQEIKVMEKISPKRHSINIHEPLIEQKYFREVEKEQKRIDREHKIFKLSLGKRTKW